MQIPPSPSRALPTLPLIHHHGFSQGKETKHNHCRLPGGKGNSCSRGWSVTMAVGTRVTDTWTSTAHGRHQHRDVSRFRVTQTDKKRADVQTEIFVLLLYSTADGPCNAEN